MPNPTIVYEQRFAEDISIEYSPITSCMTVTCVLPANRFIGVHFTIQYAQHMEGILRQMQQWIGGRVVQSIYMAGVLDFWGVVPGYPQFGISQAHNTYVARLCPGTQNRFMAVLDGGGNRPRFTFNAGAVQVVDQKDGTDLTNDFMEV